MVLKAASLLKFHAPGCEETMSYPRTPSTRDKTMGAVTRNCSVYLVSWVLSTKRSNISPSPNAD